MPGVGGRRRDLRRPARRGQPGGARADRGSGIVPGNRVLLRGPNNPWLVACWSAWSRRERSRSPRCRCCGPASSRPSARSPSRPGPVRPAVHLGSHGGPARPAGRAVRRRPPGDLTSRGRPEAGRLRLRGDGRRRRGHDRVHLGDDRQAQGDHALPPRRAGHRRHVLRRVLRPAADDVFTGTPPLAFTYGLGGLVVFPLRAGASTLLVEKAAPDELAAQMPRGASRCASPRRPVTGR